GRAVHAGPAGGQDAPPRHGAEPAAIGAARPRSHRAHDAARQRRPEPPVPAPPPPAPADTAARVTGHAYATTGTRRSVG
ncbi:hypothetical protein ACFV1L_35215, partial [Kitasatospora sp. NPDC059646]